MHYAFDAWMQRTFPGCPFARYADDAVVHCRSEKQACEVMAAIRARLEVCLLTMHPEKSKIVYCKDSNRKAAYPTTQFTFLGFTFRPRAAWGNNGRRFTSFLPGASNVARNGCVNKLAAGISSDKHQPAFLNCQNSTTLSFKGGGTTMEPSTKR